MAYQVCRWYDAYPRLAFAMRLLGLAPSAVREQVLRELGAFLERHYHGKAAQWRQGVAAADQSASTRRGKRRSDGSDETLRVLEQLRYSPAAVKAASADRILLLLNRQTT
jgi:hypothetical protein